MPAAASRPLSGPRAPSSAAPAPFPDLGVVGVSGGAEAASHGFGSLRDVESRAACRALDEHLLQEVRDAGIVVTLPATPDSDQDGNCHRRRRRVLLGEDDEAAVETLANPRRLGGS